MGIVSTDRGNTVSMRKILFLQQYSDLKFPNVDFSEVLKRKKPHISTNRLLLSCTVRDVQRILKEEKGVSVSLGTVQQLKPFFVSRPTERERACCECGCCLNK